MLGKRKLSPKDELSLRVDSREGRSLEVSQIRPALSCSCNWLFLILSNLAHRSPSKLPVLFLTTVAKMNRFEVNGYEESFHLCPSERRNQLLIRVHYLQIYLPI